MPHTTLREGDLGAPTTNAGRFAGSTPNPDGDLDLTPAAKPLPNAEFTLVKGRDNGSWRLANEQTDPPAETVNGFTRIIINVGGQPHANARRRALAAVTYTDDEKATAKDQAERLARVGEQLTVLYTNREGHVWVREGTGVSVHGEPFMYVKGSRRNGYNVGQFDILDVAKGYGGGPKLLAEYNRRAAIVPVADKPDFDGIPDTTDSEEEPPNDIAAVFLIDGPNFGDGSAPGCLFLATDVQDDSIVNGYFWAPDDSGLYSEHGSMYYDEVRNRGGRVRDYQPGSLTFSQVMRGGLGDTRESAYATITGR